jgi:hypothetical protein
MHNDSKVGGILSIISGIFGILALFMMVLIIILMYFMISSDFGYSGKTDSDQMLLIMCIIYGSMGVFMAILGVLAIIGGSFALKRKHWGWALAGAISGTLTFFPCGIASLIFIVKAQPEFNKTAVAPVPESVVPPSTANNFQEPLPPSQDPPVV